MTSLDTGVQREAAKGGYVAKSEEQLPALSVQTSAPQHRKRTYLADQIFQIITIRDTVPVF